MTTHSKNRLSSITAIISFFSLLLIVPLSSANSDAIPQMATIVSEINHFPSDEQKEALSDIGNNKDYSEATRIIAKAIHDIEHQPTDEHIAALSEIIKSPSASDAEKQMAEIVMVFNHTVSSEAEDTLEKLANE